jgi:hypothetical protein
VAYTIATGLGAAPLVRELERFAEHAGLDLAPQAAPGPCPAARLP